MKIEIYPKITKWRRFEIYVRF